MPEIYSILKYKICSVCGRLKRHFLNRLTVKEGYGCLVTGHNLDDEAPACSETLSETGRNLSVASFRGFLPRTRKSRRN